LVLTARASIAVRFASIRTWLYRSIQLYWMMRKGWDYEQVRRFGPHAGQPEHRRGVQ
jgi:hypothetical protein